MITAFAILAMCAPAGATCGKIYAYTNDYDENTFTVLGGIFPPFGLFCAINLLMKE